MRIRFTPSGRDQFLSAISFIRSDNPEAAKKFRLKAERVLRRLERYPESGRLIPEFPDLPYREVIVSSYRFFYRVESDSILIAAVWHGAQIPASSLESSNR